MNTAKFSAPGSSGALANKIAWIDFGSLTLTPNGKSVHIKNTLPGNYVIQFDVSLVNISGVNSNFTAAVPPVDPQAAFGVTGYTGINGNVVLYSTITYKTYKESILLSNIQVTDSNNIMTSGYKIIVGDAEVTSVLTENPETNEYWIITTDGLGWQLVDNLPSPIGPAVGPKYDGLGTNTVTEYGYPSPNQPASGPVYSSISPKNIVATTQTSQAEGFAFGVIVDPRIQAITDIIESVSLEETALSHIINAEGEKLQKLISLATTPEEVITANKSVQETIDSISTLELVLRNKLGIFTCFEC